MTVVVLDSLRAVTTVDNGPTSLITVASAGVQGPQGTPTTVNGHSGASITLTAADVGAIATTAAGAANGVATLDATTHIPIAQLPITGLAADFMDLSTNQTVATGVKTFQGGSIVVSDGAVKEYRLRTTGSNLDFEGSGTDLYASVWSAFGFTGTQRTYLILKAATQELDLVGKVVQVATAGGAAVNTFDPASSVTFGEPVAVSQASASGSIFSVQNTTAAPSNANTSWIAAAAGDQVLRVLVSGEAQSRFLMDVGGKQQWGPGGSTALDTNFYRSAAGTLKTDTALTVGTKMTATTGLFSGAAAGGLVAITNTTTTTSPDLQFTENASASLTLGSAVSGDTNNRLQISAGGQINWGPGNTGTDVSLFRPGAGQLQTGGQLILSGSHTAGMLFIANSVNTSTNPGNITIQESASTNSTFGVFVTGDTNARFTFKADGTHAWGPGNAGSDVNLYRAAAGTLKTDNSLSVGTQLTVTSTSNLNGQVLVSNGSTPTVQATSTVTGGQIYRAVGADTNTVCFEGEVTGDSTHRWVAKASGNLEWGSGSGGRDAGLNRSATATMQFTGNQLDLSALATTAQPILLPGGTSYTPTWSASTTNPTLGNGTIAGRYFRMGRYVFFNIFVVGGSTTTGGSGAYSFSLPTAAATTAANNPVGFMTGILDHSGVAPGSVCSVITSGQTSVGGGTTPAYIAAQTSTSGIVQFTNAAPFTISGANFTLAMSGWYEAAS